MPVLFMNIKRKKYSNVIRKNFLHHTLINNKITTIALLCAHNEGNKICQYLFFNCLFVFSIFTTYYCVQWWCENIHMLKNAIFLPLWLLVCINVLMISSWFTTTNHLARTTAPWTTRNKLSFIILLSFFCLYYYYCYY